MWLCSIKKNLEDELLEWFALRRVAWIINYIGTVHCVPTDECPAGLSSHIM